MKTNVSILITFLLLVAPTLIAQIPTLSWVKQMGGTSNDETYSITTDLNGNVYTTGFFMDTVDFDPGPGIENLISLDIANIFIQKLDANGNLLWAKKVGSLTYCIGHSIATDAIGNVYVSGQFSSTADFDPGVGTTNLTAEGNSDIFILKLDSEGDFLWVKQMSGESTSIGYAISIDAIGNVYTTGSFYGLADFDPGLGTTYLSSLGNDDVFIQKLDANGNFLWAKQVGGSSYEEGRSISVDPDGNVLITGKFGGSVDFNPGNEITNLVSIGVIDIFILKLDPSGNFLWVRQLGGASSDVGRSVTTDLNGNVLVTGNFSGSAPFDIGAETIVLNAVGGTDILVHKFDSDGNALWVKQMGGIGYDDGRSITTDSEGNVYTTGNFDISADFDPGLGTVNIESGGDDDLFIQKLDTDGNYIWAIGIGDIGYERGNSINIDVNGNIYITGFFERNVDFDPEEGSYILTSVDNTKDIYILKLGESSVGFSENSFSENIIVYPNPTNGKISIEFENAHESMHIRLLSLSGQELANKSFQNTNVIQLDINQPNGIYIIEMSSNKARKAVFKIVKE